MQCKTDLMKVCCILCYEKILRIIVILQNCISLPNDAPGSHSETRHAGVEFISVKVEEMTDTEEEESPASVTSPAIKAEHDVSCVFVYFVIHILKISSIACCLSRLHSDWWNFALMSMIYKLCSKSTTLS
jgi:hypothetical protein